MRRLSALTLLLHRVRLHRVQLRQSYARKRRLEERVEALLRARECHRRPRRRPLPAGHLRVQQELVRAAREHVEALRSANASRRRSLARCRLALQTLKANGPAADRRQQQMALPHLLQALKNTTRNYQKQLVKTLLEHFYSVKRVSRRSCSIVDCELPDDCYDLFSTIVTSRDAESMLAALGYVVAVVQLLSRRSAVRRRRHRRLPLTSLVGYLNVPLPFPMRFFGSASSITSVIADRE